MSVDSVMTIHPQKQLVYPPNYLLYADILGFSHYCLNDKSRAKQVISAVNFVVSEEKDGCNLLAVSDSLFVNPAISPEDEQFHEKSVASLIDFVFKLQLNLVLAQTFLRAAIDYGEYIWFIRAGMEVIYGECVVRAVAAEKLAPTGLIINKEL